MKKKIAIMFALAAVALALGTFVSADVKKAGVKRVQAADLVALLPASDGVVTLDVRRFFNDALPSLLSANQPMLAEITGKIEEAKAKTGVDIRQFSSVAVGVISRKREGSKALDYDPVVIARGDISSGALIGAAKLAANAKYREEKFGDKTIYIFEAKKIVADNSAKAGAPAGTDKVLDRVSSEIAVTALDSTTLALGDPVRVRETLTGKTRISADLLGLLATENSPVVTFAGRVPAGVESLLPLDNDELGKSLASIRYMFGNLDVTGGNAAVHAVARTLQSSQAKSLLETLEGLQMVGKAFLGGAKGVDKEVYARMIDNAKFTTRGNDVMLDLAVSQSDIDILVGSLKVK
jgi:hypothetical protein